MASREWTEMEFVLGQLETRMTFLVSYPPGNYDVASCLGKEGS